MAEAPDTNIDISVKPKVKHMVADSSTSSNTDIPTLNQHDDNESNISSDTEGPDTHSMVSSSGETGGPDSDTYLRLVKRV